MIDLDACPQRWLTATGSYGAAVSSLDLLDVDWTSSPGFGVALDVMIPCADARALSGLLERLARSAWMSEAGAWTIEQAERTWHGLGAGSLAAALDAWEERFTGLSYVHHREIVSYSDQRDACAWTLQADVEAGHGRRVWRCSGSFQLPGVPLDTDPLRSMLASIGVSTAVPCFRPRHAAALETWMPKRPGPALRVTGLVVEPGEPGEPDVVRGVQAQNPFRFRRPREVPGALGEVSHLILPLRSWHRLQDRPPAYRLVRVEWLQTTDVLVTCATADWDSPLRPAVSAPG